MKTSDRLRQLIQNKGVTPYEISASTGIAPSTLSRILDNTTKKPNAKNIKLLANYFNINHEWLARGEGEMAPKPQSDIHASDISSLLVSIDAEMRKKANKYIKEAGKKYVMAQLKTGEMVPVEAMNSLLREKDTQIKNLSQILADKDRLIEQLTVTKTAYPASLEPQRVSDNQGTYKPVEKDPDNNQDNQSGGLT